jgi:REP-associated tyrosine transposase
MHDWESQSHVKWDCKYHLVFIPNYRRKAIYGSLRQKIGRLLRELCDQLGVELLEGGCPLGALADHGHLCVSIPPKYSVANTVGFLKGKSAVRIHRELLGERRMTGLHFWARGYCVSRVPSGRGYDEAAVRRYIREQEDQDSGQDRLDLNLE